jgi:glycosyltransferase involved in cell wall biosynthesis
MYSVSLLIPVFNHEKFLPELFESIWKQDYKSIQIIAVDDGSTDNSYAVLLKFKAQSPFEMTVLRKDNGGICSALNMALNNATGELIAILASDDLLLPNRFQKQISLFQRSPDLKVLYNNGRYYINGEHYGKVHGYSRRYLAKGINASYQYVTSEVPALFIQAMIIRRSFLHKLGGFDEQTNSDDWALNIKIFQSLREPNEFAFEDIDVFLYRSHENQFHNSSIHMNELIQRVASNYFTSSQLAKFKLKYELITILREIVNFNLVGAATSFGRARNLVNELKMPVFGIFIEFLSVVYRSLILKKYLYFSLRKRVTFKN